MIVAFSLAVSSFVNCLCGNLTSLCINHIFCSDLRLNTLEDSDGLTRNTIIIAPEDKRIGSIRSYDCVLRILLERKSVVSVLKQGHGLACHLESKLMVLVGCKKLTRNRIP